ncbi:3D domain-containing protein [Bacillus sp. MRMR6]|uniref:3D domain-containing protein n=1 Tax=Bacillus sp. MRMR6 TaxID=1928617 RepID=UPI0009512D49|nr:3D domain-containing protein [Bacillus sp. MRMR6]OLS41133.1 cell wall-binding protein [Bacillus sp. MRMR6]
MQKSMKRMILIMLTFVLCVSGMMVSSAQASNEAINNAQRELEQKAEEKQAINREIEQIEEEMEALHTYISKNKEAMAATQKRIADTQQLIEGKKEGIVILQDKMLARKDVMKTRLVALQEDDNLNLVIKVFLESKDLDDFIQRASAVSTLFNADKDILKSQQEDLNQIEEDKKEIDKQERILIEEQEVLTKQQAELAENLQKRQETLTALEEKFAKVDEQLAGIASQLKAAQEQVRREQATAAAATQPSAPAATAATGAAPAGEAFYVTATAYSPEESGTYTALGYNIQANPNMKLIAVDPSVIPLGSRVWVEGYGEAIAGDTGGAIKGYKIDLLMPTKAAALQWGRRTVKVIVLN